MLKLTSNIQCIASQSQHIKPSIQAFFPFSISSLLFFVVVFFYQKTKKKTHKRKREHGVCHTVALPFILKSILWQKKNYGNLNISPCKNIIFKNSSRRNQNPSRYYNSITNLQFNTSQNIIFQNPSYKNRPITQGPKSLKLLPILFNESTHNILALVGPTKFWGHKLGKGTWAIGSHKIQVTQVLDVTIWQRSWAMALGPCAHIRFR